MKQLYRNLIAYSVEIPSMAGYSRDQVVEELNESLPVFVEIGEHQACSYGFEPVVLDGDLAQSVPGGWALRFRMDTKVVPASKVASELKIRVAAINEATGRKPGKKEKQELKSEIIHDLLPRAFSRPSAATVVFSEKTGRLYVNNGSQKICDRLMTVLVDSMASLKTSTLHVSEPKSGLTTRLAAWLQEDDEEAFGGLAPRDEVVLKGTEGRKWSIKGDNPAAAREAIKEAMSYGAQVDSIGFVNDDDGVRFRITSALRVKGLSIPAGPAEKDAEEGNVQDVFSAQIGVELSVMDEIFTRLLQLFAKAPAPAPAEDDDLEGLFG